MVVGTTYNWSGVYVGVHGGYSWGTAELDAGITSGGAGGVLVSSDGEPQGFLIGGHGGAQYQFGSNLVVGAEVDIDFSSVNSAEAVYVNRVRVGTMETQINWTASARIRAGYAFDRWLPYVTGGVAWADYDLGGRGSTVGETAPGWTVGLGAEYAFTDKLTLRGEYRYTDYDVDEDILSADPVPGGFSTFDLVSQQVTVGIGYRF